MTTGVAVRITDVTVHYGPVLALDHVSLDLAPASICGLIGMNGSGKSTLFKTMMGIVKPDSGTVEIDGGSPAAARRRAAVGYVPQAEEIDWAFPLSVRDVVMTGRYGHLGFTRRPRRRDHDAVDVALDRVHLTDLQNRQIGQLSGGQRKRAFVARAIAQEASVLLLDEPFAGVDKRSEGTITSLLRELADDGTAILISTHDLQALPRLADRAVLLMQRILADGDIQEVLRPENLVRAFGIDSLEGPVR
ncbi:metal ABC transporter ATP-binding protein [Rhodococcus triatomae]|nr:putative ABC transporter ATP-binding protein [Rhodococcus triatomae BKS 15-14]